ncbi:MAG: MinD/ParA family protein [Desulfosarcinaceae bacterium]|nr:MinD/ParA family protein [Desulfosarcinaceae bacterium]
MIQTNEPTSNIIHLSDIKAQRTVRPAGVLGTNGKRATRVLAVTSGKGGVGKTNIVANLGYALTKRGQRVLIFDADLGLGNLDVLLGIAPRYNLAHVLNGEKRLDEIIVTGPGNLHILPASSGVQELTRLSHGQQFRILRNLNELIEAYDVFLIDTAAGISTNVLYFAASAQEILVVVTPEPTAITDAYALMKVLAIKYHERHFKLIVNAAKSDAEADETYRQLNVVTSRFLDIEMEYLGKVLLDDNVKRGVRCQTMVSELAPISKASRNFAILARCLEASLPPTLSVTGDYFFGKDILQQIVE